MTDNY